MHSMEIVMMKIEHNASYSVGTGTLRLVVTIGDGQFGSTLLVVGGTAFPQVREFDADIGLSADLKGKTLSIFSVVTNTNTQTKHTSVTYQLTGGPVPWQQTFMCTVNADGDSVQYVATVVLT
jgi:hypothetical protein